MNEYGKWNFRGRTLVTARAIAKVVSAKAVWQFRELVERHFVVKPLDAMAVFEAAREREFYSLCRLMYKQGPDGKNTFDLTLYITMLWMYPKLKEIYADQLKALDAR